MTPDEIKSVVSDAIQQKQFFAWWHYALWLLLAAAGAWFGTYFAEKGKNHATKEDIGRVTDEIEKVRATYAHHLEELRGKNQLRLAALDRRLQAHQEAYTLWLKLLRNTHKHEQLWPIVTECQDWRDKNCLYLSSDARVGFKHAIICACDHKSHIEARDVQIIKKNWADILSAGDAILKGAELPPLSLEEKEELKRQASNG